MKLIKRKTILMILCMLNQRYRQVSLFYIMLQKQIYVNEKNN